MKNIELLRKIMANVAKIPSDEAYRDELVAVGILGEENGRFYLGDVAIHFAHNMMGEMADHLVSKKKKGVPKKLRNRLLDRYVAISEVAFEVIYKEFKNLLDHHSMDWCGPMVMVLILAEPTRNPEVTRETLCTLFEGFYELAPKKGPRVMH